MKENITMTKLRKKTQPVMIMNANAIKQVNIKIIFSQRYRRTSS